jgi:hypothetical protein
MAPERCWRSRVLSAAERFMMESKISAEFYCSVTCPSDSFTCLSLFTKLAPEAGLEPATRRLTAGCSTIELLWNPNGRPIYKPLFAASNGFLMRPGMEQHESVRTATGAIGGRAPRFQEVPSHFISSNRPPGATTPSPPRQSSGKIRCNIGRPPRSAHLQPAPTRHPPRAAAARLRASKRPARR